MMRHGLTVCIAAVMALLLGCGCGRRSISPDTTAKGGGATSSSELRTYRWIASERPSFDPKAGGQVVGTGRVRRGGTISIRLPEALPLPLFVAIDIQASDRTNWVHVGHDWIWDLSDRDAFLASSYPSEPTPATQYLRCVVLTVRGIRREPGVVVVEDDYLQGANVLLMPYEWGTPPPDGPVLQSDAHGLVSAGPLVGGEWYADVSAAGHCPVRVLAPTGARGVEPEVTVHLFPSMRRIGRITVDGQQPPQGTLLKVTPEIVRGIAVGAYTRLAPDGSFEIDQPILGECTYDVEIPGGRRKVTSIRGASADLNIDVR